MAPKNLHAIMVPFPAQGHITPMLQLALHLLHGGAFSTISFVNTEYAHHRILAANCDGGSRSSTSSTSPLHVPGLRLLAIPDGLPPDHGRLNDPRGPAQIAVFAEAIDTMAAGPLSQLIRQLIEEEAAASGGSPISCIISDIFYSHMMADVAESVSLPWIALWTSPIHANLVYAYMSDLLAKGVLPVDCQNGDSTKQLIDSVPGLTPFKALDVPSFLQPPGGLEDDYFFQWSLKRFRWGLPHRASLHLVNSVKELEEKPFHAFQEGIGKCLTIGPLLPPAFFSGEMAKTPRIGTSMWAEDEGCKEWLDTQEERSVLYVSFGSIVHMPMKQVEEVALGIELSGRPFLWVLRSDVDEATREHLEAFKDRTQKRGLVVSWAPQLLVLSHPSVGAFLTHCGWNSVLEGISSGVPMLAWSGGFADQNMASTYLTSVWNIGLSFTHELTEDGLLIVTREEIKNVIELVMSDGKQGRAITIKENIAQLQKTISHSFLSLDGSSKTNMQSFLDTVAHPKTPH